ncbi:twin-arginine translocase TatA/TatE family subunit, partial [Streptomyces anulatus]|uniref:twin-arginine translocase TatA/TatE family subunit n=1 Tax=Streptomyces anulatus TaxID=1892 RepID=UPI003322FA87
MFGIGELTILLLVIVAVLAVKRLPDLTRSAGKAARILKSEKRARIIVVSCWVTDGDSERV